MTLSNTTRSASLMRGRFLCQSCRMRTTTATVALVMIRPILLWSRISSQSETVKRCRTQIWSRHLCLAPCLLPSNHECYPDANRARLVPIILLRGLYGTVLDRGRAGSHITNHIAARFVWHPSRLRSGREPYHHFCLYYRTLLVCPRGILFRNCTLRP